MTDGREKEVAAETEAAEELGVLFPDREVEVTDPDSGDSVVLTVREPRFLESLKIAARAKPLIAALAVLEVEDENGVPDAAALDEALGAHADTWLNLIARATGRDAVWLARLADGDGHALSLAMWETHGPLFVRRVVTARLAAKRSLSAGSSTSSSGPDTPPGTTPSPSG